MKPLKLPLRIGLLLDHPSPHMVALLNALAERTDCAAKVVYCDKVAPGRNWGAPSGNLPHTFLNGFNIPRGIRINHTITQALARVKADIWVVNTCYTAPSTLLAVWWLNKKRMPWIYMNEPPRPRNWFFSLLKNQMLSYSLKRTWGVASTGKRSTEIYDGLLIQPKPVRSIPYYIDSKSLDRFLQGMPAAPDGRVRFVTSCRLVEGKGLEVLLEACRLLPDQGWSLTLAGDGPLRGAVERQFGAHWGPERVRFLGQIPYEDRGSVFSGQHVFVLPSLWDGWGMVVPEALVAGLPVITTDHVMSAYELIEDGVDGFMVPANDPKALAEKMAFFIEHPESIRTMGTGAKKALQGYTPAIGAETLVSLLLEVFTKSEFAKKQVGQCDPGSLTWRALTNPGNSFSRIKKEIRQASKTAVCRTAVVLRPGAKPAGHRILVYHLVLPEDRKRFEEHLKFFKDHFIVGSIADVFNAARNNREDGPPRLAITFDDGFRILMEDCLEALEKFNMKGCFFVPTGFIQTCLDSGLAASFCLRAHYYALPLEPLSLDDLKLLANLGHEIGSHGVFHLGLGMVSKPMAELELSNSRSLISEWTGKKPASFAYPYGDIRSSLGEPFSWVQRAGYSFGLTLRRGRVTDASNPFLLPREHAEGNWSLSDLKYFLSSG